MNEIGKLLQRIHDAELELGDDYSSVGERHAADDEISTLCHALARQCGQHATRLGPVAERYGEHIEDEDDEGPDPWAVVLASMRHKASELLDRRRETRMVVLEDLRRLFLAAENVAILWVVAVEVAGAEHDAELLQVVTECRTETDAQVKELVTQIKVVAPQALAAG